MNKNIRTTIRELSESIILAVVVFLILQLSMGNYKVEGSSMSPTLANGDYVIVNKLVYFSFDFSHLSKLVPFIAYQDNNHYPIHTPDRGAVIIFKYPQEPDRDFVKRIIGIPGDTVGIHLGQVFVNGVAINEPYVTLPRVEFMPTISVPDGTYFVMGDNRSGSSDSRNWGPVPEDNIIGRAWITYWPIGKWNSIDIVSW